MTWIFSDAVHLVVGIFMVAVGVLLFRRSGTLAAQEGARHQALVADRKARGTDAYFEELRALEAYPPSMQRRWVIRLAAVFLIVGGVLQLYLFFTA